MRRTILGTSALAGAAGLIWTHAGTLGIDDAWPVAVGAALGMFAIEEGAVGRIAGGVVAGVAASAAVFLAVTLALPFIPASFGVAVGVAVAVMGLAAAIFPRAVSFPAMLIGFGTFYGSYHPIWLEDRTGLLGDSAATAASLILSLVGGMLVWHAIARVLHPQPERRVISLEPRVIELEPAVETPAEAPAATPEHLPTGTEEHNP